MVTEKGDCKVCGEERYIVNRTKWLCDECNYKRLHKGKTKQEVYAERAFNKPKAKPVSVKKKSDKQRLIDMELVKVYAEIKKEREYKCTGCGSIYDLEHSHLVPRSENNSLVTDKRNIKYHCRTCHEKWESPTERVNLLDYQENLEIIQEIDEKYFNEIVGKQAFRELFK